jgi:glycosyltransferase involved in cell wall biosynthesis
LDGVDASGRNVYVAHLARALGALGHQVVVFTRRDDPAGPDSVPVTPDVVIARLRAGPARPVVDDELFPYMDEFAAALRRGLSAHRAEVVHAHFWTSGYASLAAGADAGLPVVQTFHELGSVQRRHHCLADTSPPERAEVERRLVGEADRVVATCSDELRELEALGCRGDRVSIVPAGFDDGVFHPRAEARWFEVDRTSRHVELIAVSRLEQRKGLDDVVRAVADVPATHLTIVGGPPFHQLADDLVHRELCERAHGLGVLSRLRFTGGLPPVAVARRLRAADLFVAAPWYEPFGIAAVEAMGCGLPVVGTAVGGLLDTVVDGGTGVLVPPCDPAALAATLRDLARQPERRHELGSRAAWRAHRRFAWPVVARSIADVYRRTLAGRRGLERRA